MEHDYRRQGGKIKERNDKLSGSRAHPVKGGGGGPCEGDETSLSQSRILNQRDPCFCLCLFSEEREKACISVFDKKPLTEGGDNLRSSVDPRFGAGLPFPGARNFGIHHCTQNCYYRSDIYLFGNQFLPSLTDIQFFLVCAKLKTGLTVVSGQLGVEICKSLAQLC